MKIQSLSVCVPAACLNECEFCVAKMHREDYLNQIEKNIRFQDLYESDYMKRLMFARDNGCNVIILTGDGEPLLNKIFLKQFANWNKRIPDSFKWIEIQTSGTKLDEEMLRFLRNTVGVNTISLSISSLESKKNAEYNVTKEGYEIDIDDLCSEIKRYDFNLRLSLNMTKVYDSLEVSHIFDKCKRLGANQITYRVLYESNNNTEQDKWIKKNRCSDKKIKEINKYVLENGKKLEKLPFGAIKYSVNEMSVVVDDDCMSTEASDVAKYLILRPDCKLYSKWDDKGSLVF